jgi:lipopolysaccharide export system permease protein
MKRLDAYILKKFLTTYVFVMFIIVLIITVIDYTEKLDDFIQKQAPVRAIIFDYYVNFIPSWAFFISPLIVFISVVFFTANMAARTEIVAILSSGVSFVRLMVPYFWGATIIGLLTFVMIAYVIPNGNKTKIEFEKKYVKAAFFFEQRDFHIKIAPEVYAYMESYNNGTQTGYKFTLERIVGNKLIQKLSCDHITWDSTAAKWKIFDYRIRTFNGTAETFTSGLQIDSTLNLKPDDFGSKYQKQETLTLTELNAYIKKLESRGADGVEVYIIEKYLRYANPFGVLILTAIGLIVSARKSRGGVGLQIALGFVLAFIYIMFFIFAKGLAESGDILPIIAVWLPNIIFAGVGFLLYKTIPR